MPTSRTGPARSTPWPRSSRGCWCPGAARCCRATAACAEAIALTKDFLSTLLASVRAGIDAGDGLRGCFERAEAAMKPRFGDWPVFQHVLPFDVSRAYDELRGIEHPRRLDRRARPRAVADPARLIPPFQPPGDKAMKRFLRLLAAGLALAAASHAPAQSAYPSQPVRWIVPYVAGGGTDNLARALAEAMQPSLGQPIVIDNRPGRLHQHRRVGADAGQARRLHHHAGRERGAAVQRAHVRQAALQAGERLHLHRHHRPLPGGAGGASGLPGQDRRRVRELREGQPRQGELRLARQRLAAPHGDGAVQAEGRHQHPARALQGRGAGDDRRHGRPGADA